MEMEGILLNLEFGMGSVMSITDGSMIREPASSNYTRLGAGEHPRVRIDISDLKEKMYIISGITSGGASDSISAKIYKVWLEK